MHRHFASPSVATTARSIAPIPEPSRPPSYTSHMEITPTPPTVDTMEVTIVKPTSKDDGVRKNVLLDSNSNHTRLWWFSKVVFPASLALLVVLGLFAGLPSMLMHRPLTASITTSGAPQKTDSHAQQTTASASPPPSSSPLPTTANGTKDDCNKSSSTSASASSAVLLATFDGSATTARSWYVTNDPVMGGQSHSTLTTTPQGSGLFAGTCEIVPFLNAPGFCKMSTNGGGTAYADASSFINGALHLSLRSRTPSYTGYKIAFTSDNMPQVRHGSGHHSSPSFKADFHFPAGAATNGGWTNVRVPFNTFSVDWSEYTGSCSTRDPTGTQHVCCSAAHPEVCPQATHLSSVRSLSVWAEGVEGDFDLEIQSIGAGP